VNFLGGPMFDTGLKTGLITPGLEPALMDKASRGAADVIHIELEDGVPEARKSEARAFIATALRELDWSGKLTLVRVNPYDRGFLEEDLLAIAPARPTAILLGKCQSPDDVLYADRLLSWIERREGMAAGTVRLAAMIERAAALQSIDAIAGASARMCALYIGPSDLANEVGYRRSYQGLELETMWVRCRVVLAAHLAGLLAIDSPYVPFRDLEGTYEQARWSYRLGFDVKTCISPHQIEPVARAFTPDQEEIDWANAVLEGEESARMNETSVWVAKDMMLDAPHVIRAKRILAAIRNSTSR
jgi:citrate lyase subunit beta / citryl-CoA lyase